MAKMTKEQKEARAQKRTDKLKTSEKNRLEQRAKAKAIKAKHLVKKGAIKKVHRVHTKSRFYKTPTLKKTRQPRYAHSLAQALPKVDGFDKYRIIQGPLATEKAMKKMEEENTMVFLVDTKSTKTQIREAFKRMYNVKIRQVNTLIRPDGKKKAYIKLGSESDSLNLANKIGLL